MNAHFDSRFGRAGALCRASFLALVCACSVSAAEPASDFLNDNRAGHWLGQTQDLAVWWCESGWKVGQEHAVPPRTDGEPGKVSVSAARGEYEAVQVVVRPARDCALLRAEVKPFRASTPARRVSATINEVGYVQLTHPTDGTGAPGWYPDPLPPLRTPLLLRAGRNQPLWITFYVARDTKAGEHRSELKLETSAGSLTVPVLVHVYDFTLPEETHLKSALGLGTGNINRYQHLERQEDKEGVFEKYLKNFAEHRISPYSFYDYAPIGLRFTGQGTNQHAQLEFGAFDKAAGRWLDRSHFNTFQLPVEGMGGGTFYSRRLGQLGGFQEGTPEHARLFQDYLSQVQEHLRERGWLPKAFVYWFDEPDAKDFDFVLAGMRRLKNAAPGLRRMLTTQPNPALYGQVETWCVPTFQCTAEKVRERQAAGEEVWWYICCAPKAPYVTEFIDHPGTELRLWPWQSWQYGISGILIWATTWWTSPTAFPPPQLQDPWTDPMSYQSGYGEKPGEKKFWGNGDGRFLYPPRMEPGSTNQPCLDGPVNSIRWENLRDGMEDYEYLWLLRQEVEKAAAAGNQSAILQQARQLLQVPAEISQDLKHFTADPAPLLKHREAVARMVETLQRAR